MPSSHGGKDGSAPAMDSLDECCLVHDKCYGKCEKLPKDAQKACFIQCDRELVKCLRDLDDDCTKWPKPPRDNTQGDSQTYRDDAMRLFTQEIKKWDSQRR